MKTQEKNFDGIKLSGFTAILIMLALTGTAIYLLSLPQTPSIDFFRQICRNGHK